jgi:hypothetical protein
MRNWVLLVRLQLSLEKSFHPPWQHSLIHSFFPREILAKNQLRSCNISLTHQISLWMTFRFFTMKIILVYVILKLFKNRREMVWSRPL